MSILFIVLFIYSCNGFLLQKNDTAAITDEHYIYLMGLLGQERKNVQQMEHFILKLNVEMKSLQQKVAGLDQRNESSQEIINLQNGYSALQTELNQVKQELNKVKNDNSVLNQELTQVKNKNHGLQNEISICSNDTLNLKTELETLKNSLLIAGKFKNVTQIQSSVENLEHKMDKTTTQLNALTLSSNARSQDFLALLNQTKDTQRKITTLETDTKQGLANYQNSTNKKMNNVYQRIAAINQTVVLTSCANGELVSDQTIVKFPNTKTVYGISDLNAFKSSGKFTCEVAGVYLFSVFIMSHSTPSHYIMFKNNGWISYVNIVGSSNGGTNYHTGTGIVAVSLNVGDTLYVKAHYDIFVHYQYSCMNVIKIR